MKPTLPMTAALLRFDLRGVDLTPLAKAEIDFERKYAALEQWLKDTRKAARS